jgi:branched-chain amino acid transport system substrate-binding protein
MRLMRKNISTFTLQLLFLAVVASLVYPVPQLRIGVSLSLTGEYRETAAMMLQGYRLWEKEVNARGGLLGRQVLLLVEDDQSNPQKARAIYERFALRGETDLVLAPYGTPITLEVSEVTEKAGYVLITAGAAAETIWNRGLRNVFGLYAPGERFFIGFLDLLAREGIESVLLVREKGVFHQDAAVGIRKWAGNLGVTLDGDIEFDPLKVDYGSLAQQIQTANPEALILSTYPDPGYALLQEFSARRYRPDALALAILGVHPDFFKKAGPIGEGVFAPSQWEPVERLPFPGTREFMAAFTALTGLTPAYHATSAFASCQLLEKAVQAVGSLDQARIRDYISSLDTVTVLGRFKVDPTGLQIGHNTITIQWQDGRKVIVYPPQMRTAAPRF